MPDCISELQASSSLEFLGLYQVSVFFRLGDL
jgi:hypothetical protein